MKHYYRYAMAAVVVCVLLQLPPLGSVSYGSYGDLVLMEQLSFYPDTLRFPGDAIAVLVVQNREEGPIQHEVLSQELFQPGTLVSIAGTGAVEYDNERVAKILLSPGEEIVISFYARKGWIYAFQCNINGHAMEATIRTF
jgi:uncharacterized cupredoxin-like copper-binding protein